MKKKYENIITVELQVNLLMQVNVLCNVNLAKFKKKYSNRIFKSKRVHSLNG